MKKTFLSSLVEEIKGIVVYFIIPLLVVSFLVGVVTGASDARTARTLCDSKINFKKLTLGTFDAGCSFGKWLIQEDSNG
jgi:flagellar biosynthesis protein FliQ